jgi:hypothetical protein
MVYPDNINFNVGGTRYEVAKSLVDFYPESLLAKSLSEQWKEGDPNAEILIEGDGERFQYVLAFMQGAVFDVTDVSSDELSELFEFYGIEIDDEDNEEINQEEINKVYEDTHALMEAFLITCKENDPRKNATADLLDRKPISIVVKERKGKSFLDCNKLLSSFCVEKEDYCDVSSSYNVTVTHIINNNK